VERTHLGDKGVDGKIIMKMNVREIGCEDVNWLRIGWIVFCIR
jgi:hypothetical protein